jgi:hypothetical protein
MTGPCIQALDRHFSLLSLTSCQLLDQARQPLEKDGPRFQMGWWFGLAPATLEFWVRFPNERNQGKQAHPVLEHRVPHGSHCVH